MKVILPVAGKGTRLRPHTYSRPKSLVRVAGKTVLEHIITNLLTIKITEIVFIADENAPIIEKFIRERYPDLPAKYIIQEEKLGPAHAVWLAASRIKMGDDVLIVFNDTLFVTDLTQIPRLCKGFDGLIYSKEVEDYQRFGVNVMKDGIIVDMVEKPDHPVSKLAQVGLYYLRDGKRFMKYLDTAISRQLTLKGEYYLPEVFKLMIADGMKLAAPEIEEWLDCGKPETLLSTNRYLLEHAPKKHFCIEGCAIIPPVDIHESAQIRHSVIGPHVSIAEGCLIEDSVIKDSIINANTTIRSVVLERSLVGDSAKLTGNAKQINIGDNSIIDMGGQP